MQTPVMSRGKVNKRRARLPVAILGVTAALVGGAMPAAFPASAAAMRDQSFCNLLRNNGSAAQSRGEGAAASFWFGLWNSSCVLFEA